MVGHFVETLCRKIKWFLLWSPGTELFKCVEVHLRDSLEMTELTVITLGETLHSLFYFISWF